MMERPRVAVVMGGPSAEHEISLKSGQGILTALQRLGWNVQPLVIPQDRSVHEASRYARQDLQQRGIDVAFLALHGPFGEDGTMQTICEELDIAYTGSDAAASRMGLDKVESRRRFEQAGLGVPRWALLEPAETQALEAAITRLGFPVVVKPTNQGSSIGVSIAVNHGELVDALECAARYDSRILVEEFIRGRELTVGVLGHTALPLVEIRPNTRFFDYTAKYTPGQTSYEVPAPLEDELTRQVQDAGLRAHQALGCQYFSRVDVMLSQTNQPVILEVNTIPGFTATSLLPKAAACAGILYEELCERLVLMALAAHQEALNVVAPVHPASAPVTRSRL